VLIKDAGIEQLELRVVLGAAAILIEQLLVGELSLRVLVQEFHVRVGRRAVLVEVVFLHVLAVIAFVAGEPEHALFEDRVFAVPQSERETDLLMTIRDAGNAVFIPAIGARAGMVVGEVIPSRAVRAIVFAHRPPGSFTYVGSPSLPVGSAVAGLFKSDLF